MKKKDYRTNRYFIAGLLMLTIIFVWTLINKDSLMVYYHDQLDGEMSYFMLKASSFPNIFESSFSSFMNGQAMVEVASYLSVLFYVLFKPLVAFIVNLYFVRIVSYIGMYRLLRKFSCEEYISVLVALLFALLPFYSVYGYSVMGIPLVISAFIDLYHSQHLALSYMLIVLYGLCSSLVLSGYFVVGFAAVHLFVHLFRKEKTKQKFFLIGVMELTLIYLLENYPLVLSVLFKVGTVSHKADPGLMDVYVRINDAVGMLLNGFVHAISNHHAISLLLMIFVVLFILYKISMMIKDRKCRVAGAVILCVAYAAVFVSPVYTYGCSWLVQQFKISENVIKVLYFIFAIMSVMMFYFFNRIKLRKNEAGLQIKYMAGLFVMAVLITGFYWLWHIPAISNIRKTVFETSALKYFQFDRLYWAIPTIFYSILGLILSVIDKILPTKGKYALIAALYLFCVYPIGKDCDLKMIVKKAYFPERTAVIERGYIGFNDFFQQDMFDEIAEYIGKDKGSYKVASVGLYPSIPLYNGFNCVDGYSNNYNIEYKHQFLQVIENEISKDKDINQYFTLWGNRCYLFSAELGKQYLIDKNKDVEITLDINTEKLKQLGCDYLFSSVEIKNSDNIGVNFMKVFDDKDSYYKIYLYQLDK